ncbi:Osteoclast-stimulating factor 1, partial [Caligus rogercresseyi]
LTCYILKIDGDPHGQAVLETLSIPSSACIQKGIHTIVIWNRSKVICGDQTLFVLWKITVKRE